MLNGV